MATTTDDLRHVTLGRQFPSGADDLSALVAATGPIQSQTARSPFVGLAARRPGTTHAEVSAAYAAGRLVRGSLVRGTVHTVTPAQHAALDAATRVGQRTLWTRALRPETYTLEELWSGIEAYAAGQWRTADDLSAHLDAFLRTHGGAEVADRRSREQGGRYLAFGHGGLVRRPVTGSWSGQGRPEYRTAAAVVERPPATLGDAVALHVRAHGPVTRHDIAWWSGLGLRVVDEVLDRIGLVGTPGPDGRTYVDLPDPPPGRDLPGVRLLPEFDALMCAYEPTGRDRFADPAHLRRLWSQSNGLVLPPLLVDGRISGFWRATGPTRRRRLEVGWFARTRRPRRAEIAEASAVLEAALDISVTEVTITREAV